jgi:hypothetical protein
MAVRQHNFETFVDYHQFCLEDESAPIWDGDVWTDEAHTRQLAVAPGVVVVGTARNTSVPIGIDIRDEVPDEQFGTWDRVVDCTMTVRSGLVVVRAPTQYFPTARRVAVPPAVYRVRVRSAGLDTVSGDACDGSDHYSVTFWPAPPAAPRVHKLPQSGGGT